MWEKVVLGFFASLFNVKEPACAREVLQNVNPVKKIAQISSSDRSVLKQEEERYLTQIDAIWLCDFERLRYPLLSIVKRYLGDF